MFRITGLVGLLFVLAFAVSAQNLDGDWLSGSWEGTGYQIDDGSTWPMRVTASDGKYSVEYPSLKCGGEWRIVSMGLEKATFKERITYGKDNCVDDGNVVIERLNGRQISFRHSLPDTIDVIASAILRMKMPVQK